ncbi:MAG: hypothetical protein ACT4QF_07775 [Sporichthyaceae bacterium]
MLLGSKTTRMALAAALAAAAAPFVGGGTAQADASYEALASATGVRTIFSNQSIPLGVEPQLQGPTAQAKQTSLQQSDALAAFPFPGEELAGAPGVVGGALGVAAPPYPFLVTSAFGDDVKRLSYPGVELSSESGETVTQASATAGSKGAGATSTARIAREGQEVLAKASTDADGIRLGESLIVNGLKASATAARDAAGKLTRSSTLSFASISAPGLELGLPSPPSADGPGSKLAAPSIGFVNGQFTVTVPGSDPVATPIPAKDVFDAFAAAGYKITYQAPQETADGIVGAGLQIATTLPSPPDGSPGGLSGETPVTFSLGLARAEISYAKGAETAVAGVETPAVGPLAPPAQPPAVEVPTALVPEIPFDTPASAPLASAAVASPAAAAPAGAVSTVDFAQLTAFRPPVANDVGWIYLMVAAVGAAMVGCLVLLRGAIR